MLEVTDCPSISCAITDNFLQGPVRQALDGPREIDGR